MGWKVRRRLPAPIVVVALLESGCLSLWAVGPPPSPPIDPKEPLECTQAVVAPVIDTGVAALLGYGALALAGSSAESRFATAGAIFLGVPALISGVSAVKGYRSTARCRELDDALDGCLAGDREACAMLGAPGRPEPPPEPTRPPERQPGPPEPPRPIEPQPPPPLFFAPASRPG